MALRHLENQPAMIVETGSSAWGTNSSLLWDSYVKKFGGCFFTVDIREKAATDLRPKLSENSKAFVGDSVEFLRQLELPAEFSSVSLVYLDSMGVDLENQEPAMQVGLSEFLAVHPFLTSGSIVVIDDTPIEFSLLGDSNWAHARNDGLIPGKGALILRSPLMTQYDVLYHHYNVVLKKK